MYAWWITLRSGANLGREILRFHILTYANGKEIWRVMSEQVGSEAYSGVDRCDVLHGSRLCRFRAREEREPVSEVWESSVLPLNYARSISFVLLTNSFSVQQFE